MRNNASAPSWIPCALAERCCTCANLQGVPIWEFVLDAIEQMCDHVEERNRGVVAAHESDR